MKVLIAGGGTGGHLYPGVALAEEVTTRKKGNEVLFVGTRRGIEARVIPELGYPIEYVEVVGIKGKGLWGLIKGLSRLPSAWLQSIRILKSFQPDIAIGVGGYASGPLILAARYRGVPTAILEQNTVPGLTNRLLGRVVRTIFVMFERSREFFPEGRVQPLGNPIRRSLLDNFLRSRMDENGRFNLLVFGGSQGAHMINQRMIEAAKRMVDRRSELQIVHQTGRADAPELRRQYEELGFEAEVLPFIEDMSEAYRRADLVICRAGATTLAELMVAKKACILIPFPHATDDHQQLNAESMEEAGAAVLIPEAKLTPMGLADEILRLKDDAAARREMEDAAGAIGRPEAAREIIDACAALIGGAS